MTTTPRTVPSARLAIRASRAAPGRERACEALKAVALASMLACRADPGPAGLAIPLDPKGVPVAIVGARVLALDSPTLHDGWTVVVRGDRIEAAGPASATPVPDGALFLDASGLVLLPGLADMHVHVRRADLRAYARHGITTVRNMWGTSDLLLHTTRTGAALVPDSVVAPTIYSASPGVDRPPGQWPQTRFISHPGEATTIVAGLRAEGWRAIKLYSSLSREDYDALVSASHEQGVDPVGHVPFSVSIEHALASGQRSVEHLGGYDRAVTGGSPGALAWANADDSRFRELARLTREAGTWNCPTWVVHEALIRNATAATRASAAAARRAFLRELHSAGAPILAGTDAGIGLTAPGASLVEELRAFVAAGMTPYEAIEVATVRAAEFLREPGEFGVIRPGARADLLLVGGNPLEDMSHLARPRIVMARGRWVHDSRSDR